MLVLNTCPTNRWGAGATATGRAVALTGAWAAARAWEAPPGAGGDREKDTKCFLGGVRSTTFLFPFLRGTGFEAPWSLIPVSLIVSFVSTLLLHAAKLLASPHGCYVPLVDNFLAIRTNTGSIRYTNRVSRTDTGCYPQSLFRH